MKKSTRDIKQHDIRGTNFNFIAIIKINKVLLTAVMFISIIATGLLGFSLGGRTNDKAYHKETEASKVVNLDTEILAQNIICLEIEKIDSERQNEVLKDQNTKNEKATATISDTILGALLSNLESKKVTNRSLSVNSYVAEAKNLIVLNSKLVKFEKTENYDLIDLSKYKTTLTTRLSRIPTMKPIPGSFPDYGWRIHPVFHYRQFHAASDQGAPSGTPIKAAGAGYVVQSSYNGSSGNFIVINHGNGFVTTYMHNSKNIVHVGRSVKKGEIIGKVGSTGTATGPHLHFQVTYNGSPFNPQQILIQ